MEQREAEKIPFGPLTRQTWNRLGTSSLDASQTDMHRVAAERGVELGEVLRRGFKERVAERQAERAGADPNPEPHKPPTYYMD